MKVIALTLARTASSAWVGAAVLFVMTSVREIRWPAFDSLTRDTLVALRFPLFYQCGTALLGIGVVGAALAYGHPSIGRRRCGIALGLLMAALAILITDYLTIYRPLADAINPPGGVRPTWFETYHHASKWINAGQVASTLVATLLLNLPRSAKMLSMQEASHAERWH